MLRSVLLTASGVALRVSVQVEYWALLEELRATHSTVAQAGAAPVTGSSGSRSMQELWQASVAATSDAQKPAQQQREADGRAAGQTDKQQEPALTSPFAAAAQPYGDQRCGFATESCEQDPSQPQQQQQQLLLPSLDQAEALLQQLAAGGRDAGAADPRQLQEWRQRWTAVSPSVAGLEQLASAATMQYMDAQGER